MYSMIRSMRPGSSSPKSRTSTMLASPRVATARVVNGKVVTRAKFPEGTLR